MIHSLFTLSATLFTLALACVVLVAAAAAGDVRGLLVPWVDRAVIAIPWLFGGWLLFALAALVAAINHKL